MTWVNPMFLWGLLGLSVPILIHLWSGRRGKVLLWAATAWLHPQESQSSRSFKLAHRLLLLIRILFWTAIVMFIVGIWWKGFSATTRKTVIHAFVPDEQLVSEFRFEFNQAKENGEKVVWLGENLREVREEIVPLEDYNPENLQNYLDALGTEGDSIHLYVKGTTEEFPQETYWLNSFPVIHISEHAKLSKAGALIQLDSGKFLGLDQEGTLEIGVQNPSSKPVLASPISYTGKGLKEEKRQGIQAGLDAISEVYGIEFLEVNSDSAKLIFALDTTAKGIENQVVLTFDSKDKFLISDPVMSPWQELVDKGILPELILRKILIHFGIDPEVRNLSKAQVAQRFQIIPERKLAKASNSSEILLALILILFILERYLAYRSNQ